MNSKYGFKINLDPNQIINFQAWHAEHKIDNYFSKCHGRSIIDIIKRQINLNETVVVDYGCGPGFLTRRLVGECKKIYALDISEKSIEAIKSEKLDSVYVSLITPGCPNLEEAIADVVILVETIEHLDDDMLSTVLTDIYRMLKPGGKLFITTPNDEDIENSNVLCPNCGAVFHPVLHLRSLSENTLKTLLKNYGFRKIKTGTTIFSASKIKERVKQLLFLVLKKKGPILYAVATK